VSDKKRMPIRVLVADDEADVRDAYRQILCDTDMSSETAVFHNLRERLFNKAAQEKLARNLSASDTTFIPVFCDGAEAAVAAVRDALGADKPFAVAFLDMRMPPGPDGIWAAARIRELDPPLKSSCARPIRTSTRAILVQWCLRRRSSPICKSRFIRMKSGR
jgi:diguanylate cyclase